MTAADLGSTRQAPVHLGRLLRTPQATLVAALVVIVTVGAWSDPSFGEVSNLRAIGQAMVAPLILALGASVALYAGVVDLSIGSALGLSGMVFALVLTHTGSLALALITALVTGLAVGLFNAIVSVGFGVPSLVATIATLGIARGVALALNNSHPQPGFDATLDAAVTARVGGVDVLMIGVVTLTCVAALYLVTSRPGRHLKAVGGDASAANRAGISVRRCQFVVLVLCGVGAALSAIVHVAQLGSAPANLGVGIELQVFAAALLGGYSISRGGVGSPFGTLLGLATLTLLANVLRLNGVSSAYQDLLTGLVLASAVWVDTRRRGDKFV